MPGWISASNELRRLLQAPKRQLADPALAASVFNLSADALLDLAGVRMVGPLFESLVTLGVQVAAQSWETKVFHLRNNAGEHEIDLIVQGDGQVLAIEVKLAHSVSDTNVRYLLRLREQIPDRVADLVVVATGTTAYRRRDGVAVIPLALLGP